MSVTWHLPEGDIRGYADRGLGPPVLWSVEAHLAACPQCRERLAAMVDPRPVEAGWARLDAELDAPVPGGMERLLLRLGVSDHTARLLVATPSLRRSWLTAVTLTLAFTTVLGALADQRVFLAVVPVLALAGVAAAFGPGVDPTYELTLVAPMHTFRLLLLRCVAVLSVTSGLAGVASLALPQYGLAALGWFLPTLVLAVLSLHLTPRLGPVPAAGAVGTGWIGLVVATYSGSAQSVVFTPAGQLAAVAIGVLAAVALLRLRHAFDTSHYRRVLWLPR